MSIKIEGFPPSTAGITGGLIYRGTLDPSSPPANITSAKQGDYYVVNATGTLAGVELTDNDHILFNQDASSPLTSAMFDKIDNTEPAASETVAGIIEIATNAEAGAATATNKALVPSNISSINTSDLNNDAGFISSVASASETVAGVIEIATNAEATTGTATDKALVPSNLSSVGTSQLNNDAGFITSFSETDTLDSVVGRGSTTTTSITTGGLTVTGDIDPNTDDTYYIGNEDARFISYYGDMNGAIRFKAKVDQTGGLDAGEVVYINGVSGTVPTVAKAQANASSTMPAFGLVYADANDTADVEIITFGNLTGLDTSLLTLNSTLYVSSSTAGGLTTTPPTGESNLIQNIGFVVRSDNGSGIIKVGGAGRTNATPNLDQDKVFLGNASNQAVATALSSINLSSFNNDSGFITDIAAASTTVAGKIEIATNSEATAGTELNKALVPSNIGSIKLNQLDEVSYTAGLSIDNYVLTYVDSNGQWEAKVSSISPPSVTTDSSGTDTTLSAKSGNEEVHLISNGASAVTITINSASSVASGFKYQIKRLGTANVTVKTATPSTDGQIDSSDTYVIANQNESVTLVSDGSDYFII